MRKLLRLSILLAAIPLLIACEKVINSEVEYEVNHWPIVKTLEITNVTMTSARLNAAVNAFNLPTTVTFEYGKTTSYGDTVTANPSPVTGYRITNVSAIISGLLPYTTYHVRVKAENSIWKNFYGSDKTFICVDTDTTNHNNVRVVVDSADITNYNNLNSGLPNNIVEVIVIDGSNNIWMTSSYMSEELMGTIGSGVSKFDGTNWTTYTTADGLADNEVLAIAIDSMGNKWFGTYYGGVSKFDGKTWTNYSTTNSGLVNDYINSIAIDAQGNKWFGTWGGGVSKFDGTSWTSYTTEDGLANNQVFSIVIDAQDNKWIGTHDGVSKFDGKTWTNYSTTNSGLVNDEINSIAIDAQGSKWFGTHEGISKFDGTNWTTYPFNTFGDHIWSSGLPVHAIAIDAQGNKWFGSEYGITKFDGTIWTNYTTANGHEIGMVVAIDIDSEGNKWLGTYGGGVSKLSFECK